MRPERDELLAAAAETRFPAETLEKVARLGELVVEIGRHPLLGRSLALKGGTALNLLADVPPRLSVDLDFNFVGALDRDEMLRQRPEIEASVERISRALGYRIQRSREEHAGRKLFLGYRDLYEAPNRIEIDLNFLNRQPLLELTELALWQPAGAPRPSVRAMALEEIAAGKLCALLDRAAARDLYDATKLPERLGAAWEGREFRRLFVASRCPPPSPTATTAGSASPRSDVVPHVERQRIPYNTAPWRALVMCQEIGHDFGLDHQDENFNNANLGTCMDYTSDPDGPPSNEHPNSHDYQQLASIYAHLDDFNSWSLAVGGQAALGVPPAMIQIDFAGPAHWGRLVRLSPSGAYAIFELDFGGGNKVLTHVTWTVERAGELAQLRDSLSR
jgi:hypothetical protein